MDLLKDVDQVEFLEEEQKKTRKSNNNGIVNSDKRREQFLLSMPMQRLMSASMNFEEEFGGVAEHHPPNTGAPSTMTVPATTVPTSVSTEWINGSSYQHHPSLQRNPGSHALQTSSHHEPIQHHTIQQHQYPPVPQQQENKSFDDIWMQINNQQDQHQQSYVNQKNNNDATAPYLDKKMLQHQLKQQESNLHHQQEQTKSLNMSKLLQVQSSHLATTSRKLSERNLFVNSSDSFLLSSGLPSDCYDKKAHISGRGNTNDNTIQPTSTADQNFLFFNLNGRKRSRSSSIPKLERQESRMEKNRESAKRSRLKKYHYTQQLEVEIEKLQKENKELKVKIQKEVITKGKADWSNAFEAKGLGSIRKWRSDEY